MVQQDSDDRKVTTHRLLEMKQSGIKIAALTAYDATMAELLDAAGVDLLLVGDSVAMVMQGLDTTVTVSMETMLYHATLVRRGVSRALVVGDLPFMSYQVNSDEALRNAGRMVKEAGVEAVKLEGGEVIAKTVRRIVDVGIPVMGHLGLTPQSIHKFGTYQVRAREPEEADVLRRDAERLEAAGAFAIVLEKVPHSLAAQVAKDRTVPIIGIGAGSGCDGQILVSHDMLGLYTRFKPRFVRRYGEIAKAMGRAFEDYVHDVRAGEFPNLDESYE
ncbi:MAG: 3-methyl-2-oxobutanoate hydroxymethyltransferase [Planctomycetes bacterium]|nr:3-methyl-2-oxobutanoate hydroxymethyltransferase [Planctomycetota bacterium]MCB9909163.1 3-methyl-2-oxobutanoate hydroxymethyltransferase [Planctomycetota bacterium]HPF15388.1 3-methyl-2-oxobutanoate hydroxymethyltransferase [Planctomycetota bacterium]HRV80454.1 3-methyl-2-oxobutanoate hydroxymethyltransferase [Planctomycetota bacterium]